MPSFHSPSICIDHLNIRPGLLLAPVAGHTHAAFRELVGSYGGCGLFYTEVLNSRLVASQNPAKDPFLTAADRDRPLAAQVAGNDPETVARAFERLQGLNRFSAYDFNLGCPRGPAQRYGWGAALLADPKRTAEILTDARHALKAPFLVKMRDPSNGLETDYRAWAELLERVPVDGVVFHPRTSAALFKRPARWERLKRFRNLTELPVIGNGDIFSPLDAVRMLQQTGCKAVMIGRAALMRPWIFRDIMHFFDHGRVPEQPDPLAVIERYQPFLQQFSSPQQRVRRFKSFCFWFLQNFAYGWHYFKTVSRQSRLDPILERLRALLAGERIPDYPCRPFMTC